MSSQLVELPEDPAQALKALQAASQSGPVVVFKHSPICPVSLSAQHRFRTWLEGLAADSKVRTAQIDVIAQRALARGLVAELGIAHESPQALCFANGALVWHGSHAGIDASALDRALASESGLA